MFGLKFIKTQPNQYVIQFRNGRPCRQGRRAVDRLFRADKHAGGGADGEHQTSRSCSRR